MGAERVHESPGDRAPRWDRISRWYNLQVFLERPAFRTAVALAAPRATDSVIDVACGTGALLGMCASLPAENRPHVGVGVDASAAMLRHVPELPTRWRVTLADAQHLQQPDTAFDLAFATYVLHLMHPRARRLVIREIRRVLRPGGRVVTITPLPLNDPAATWRAHVGARLAKRFPTTLGGLRPYDPARDLESAGFTVERRQTVRRGYPSLCILATVT